MNYTEICNQPWIFLFAGIIIALILGQNFVMMRKAWRHAKNDLGYTDSQIKKAMFNGISISIVPTIPVIVVMLALIPMLGTPLPWLRLSVIGSATIESIAATLGIESVGEVLQVGGYTIAGWIAACWVMNLGNSSSLVWSTIAIKPICSLYGAAEKFDIKLVLAIGAGCLCGIMGYSVVSMGLSAMSTKGIVYLPSFALGTAMTLLAKKNPKFKWMNEWLMAICMIFGMILAMIIL